MMLIARRHLACSRPQYLDIVRMLLQAGAQIDAPTNAAGLTPRQVARESGLDLSAILPCAMVENTLDIAGCTAL